MVKILAIDDNHDNLIVLKALLSAAFPEAAILTSLSGDEGILKARVENPDVILLDLVMPGMDGYETCKILKEDRLLQRIPVIILTARHTDSESRVKALNLGAETFLTKPVVEAELIAQITSMLRNKLSDNLVAQENERLEALVFERTRGLEASRQAAVELLENLKAEMEAHRQAEEALRQSEEQFRNLYNEAPVGLYRTTPDGKILLANRAIYEMLGFTGAESLSATKLEEIGFEPLYRREHFTRELANKGEVRDLESKWTCSNGQVINVRESAKVIRDAQGIPVYYDGTVEDITSRKRAEEALKTSEEQFRALARSANDAIITSDCRGIISGWNLGAEKIFGYTEEEITGQNLAVIMPARYSVNHAQNVERLIKSGEPHVIGKTIELQGLHKSGREFPLELSLSEWETDSGKFFFGIIRDITERKRAEHALKEALVKAESGDRLRKAFMNNISHEIRTPLNGILGFSELITDPGISNEEKVLFSSLLNISSNRLLNTITNYMDISLIASGNMKVSLTTFNLHESLHKLMHHFQPICAEKKLELTLEIPESADSITLLSDAELFQKIFSQLLDNAIKFSDKGIVSFGYIINQAGTVSALSGEPSGKSSRELEFFVRDTGIGIGEASLSVIFESFVQEELSSTRGHEGSGLGLSIVQGLVRLLGGEIRVKSEKGTGSAFFFTLPGTAAGTEPAVIPLHKPIPPPTGGKVVLIAEDDEANLQFIETLLRKKAIPLLLAVNGKSAVALCREHPEISLVLMDIKMPVMDGLEATREIKTFRKELPVIALTAYAMSGDEQRALDAGCDDYLTKPLSKDELIKKLEFFKILD
ncbi:MAG: response regulator [Bacteroidota bacterium]